MESIRINNSADEKLAACLFLPERKPLFLLIVCHGFRGAKENAGRIFQFAQRVNGLGGVVCAFDFSGSGESEGSFTQVSLTRQAADLKAVMNEMTARFALPLVLLGRSFGGSTVIAAGGSGEAEKVLGLILWSTPVFMTETFTGMLPETDKKLSPGQILKIHDAAGDYELDAAFLKDLAAHDMDQYLQALQKQKVLIIHARDDEIVPVENALYMNSKLPGSSLHLIDEAGHRFMDKTELRENITLQWLEKIIEGL